MPPQKKPSDQKDEPQAPEEAAAEAVEDTEASTDAYQWPVDQLVSNANDLLGHPPHEVAGALSGVSEKELTVKEARAAVKAWLKSEVKED